MSKEKSCRTCGFFAELKEPFERSDGAVIYGYCFKDGDKDYSPNMGKGFPVFVDGGGGACKQYKRRRAALREQKTPCASCGYGGKHLDAPPCTTCPAHPKLARNLHDVASKDQVTESLQRNGSGGSEEAPASKNQVKGIRLMTRPWQPQDLLDDLQLMIDEEPDSYLNDRRTTLCMARGFLKEHFAESGWISVEDRLPKEWKEKGGDLINYLVFMPEYGVDVGNYAKPVKTWLCMGIPCKVTHWMPLPEPPKGE